MKLAKSKREKRLVRHRRARAKIIGTATRPRLVIFRSINHIEVQLVDDTTGRTLLSVNDKKFKGSKSERAQAAGKQLAKAALAKKIVTVLFDRGGYKYHGRVKALAESARKAGLQF